MLPHWMQPGWIKRARLSPIGLDLGAREIKAAQLMRGSDGAWKVIASAIIPREQGNDVALSAQIARVRGVLDRRGFRGHGVVIAVPGAKLLASNLELPQRAAETPLDDIARIEFCRTHKQPAEALEFDYWDLPAPARATRATHVMGVGCTIADSEPIVDACEAAGLDVIAADVDGCALTRACSPMLAPTGEITAILDLGWQSTRLFVVHQSIVTYRRALEGYGMERLSRTVSEQLEIDAEVVDHLFRTSGLNEPSPADDESTVAEEARRLVRSHLDAVVAEVLTSLSYAAHQYPDAPVRRVLLVGGAASVPGVVEYLAAMLGVDTRLVRVSAVTSGDAAADEYDAAGVLALGLAQFVEQLVNEPVAQVASA